jgi:alanine dehydrogenase
MQSHSRGSDIAFAAPPDFLRRMTIGVPKESKIGETRVSMTPSLCRRCVGLGARVLIQKSAGVTAGFTDAEYRHAGATLVANPPISSSR